MTSLLARMIFGAYLPIAQKKRDIFEINLTKNKPLWQFDSPTVADRTFLSPLIMEGRVRHQESIRKAELWSHFLTRPMHPLHQHEADDHQQIPRPQLGDRHGGPLRALVRVAPGMGIGADILGEPDEQCHQQETEQQRHAAFGAR